MFLAMLAKLERQDLLKPDSEIKNLGVIMAMYIKLTDHLRSNDVLPDDDLSDDEDDEISDEDNESFNPTNFDAYILAYATKYNVKLLGLSNIDDLVGELEKVDLPAAGDDPWGWIAAFEEYVGPSIGGDSLDITSWSSAERKAKSFDNKDPLGKKERDMIKEGTVLRLR
jgi:hypothetical protein